LLEAISVRLIEKKPPLAKQEILRKASKKIIIMKR